MGNAKAGAGAITNAVTTSSAQAEQAVRDKKKARDEARERGEAAATSESESEEEEEEEVQDVKAAEKPVADGAASKDKKPLSEQQEGQEEEEQGEFASGHAKERLDALGDTKTPFLTIPLTPWPCFFHTQTKWTWSNRTTMTTIRPVHRRNEHAVKRPGLDGKGIAIVVCKYHALHLRCAASTAL